MSHCLSEYFCPPICFLSAEMSSAAMSYNVFQARAVPVVRKVKCTNVQRNAKMQNEQAWILLGVTTSFYVNSLNTAISAFAMKRAGKILVPIPFET